MCLLYYVFTIKTIVTFKDKVLCTLHILVYIVASGEVFTWGSGSYGRLGHGNLRDRFSPLMIGGVLRGVGITFVACHEFHSLAVAGM